MSAAYGPVEVSTTVGNGLQDGLAGVPVLVVGVDGALGRSLVTGLSNWGAMVYGTSRRREGDHSGHAYLDLAEEVRGWRPVTAVRVAYLCAGITSLAACREDPVGTGRVNVTHTLDLARRLHATGTFVVYVSTNLVFNGERPFQSASGPYHPLCEYARQKVDAEKEILSLGDGAAVLRVTKVLAADRSPFSGWLKDLRGGCRVRAFTDLVMAPVTTGYVTTALARIGALRLHGVTQITGDRDISYAAAAAYVAQSLGTDPGQVQGIRSEEAGVHLDARPCHTTLDSSRAERSLGLGPQNVWQSILEAFGL